MVETWPAVTTPTFSGPDGAARRLETGDAPAVARDAGDLAVLDDVDAERVGAARIAPGHGVVAAGAAARLVVGAEDRIAAVGIVVDDRHDLLHLGRRDHAAVEAGEPVGVRGALEGAELVLGLAQHEHAARGEHDVEVQLLRQVLVERASELVDGDRRVLEVVGADDRGVAPGVAAAEPALLDHRDVGQLVVLGEVVGGGEAMAAGADDDRVIFRLGLGRTPGAFPILVVVHRVAREREDRIARLHGIRLVLKAGSTPAAYLTNGRLRHHRFPTPHCCHATMRRELPLPPDLHSDATGN